MAEPKIGNIREALTSRSFPTITVYNRLEARPRTLDFDRSTRAEVRDALWMLTRQWQMGEYRGDDAASVIFAKIHFDTRHLTKYQADQQETQPFNVNLPLEAQVEQRPLPFAVGSQAIALDLRLLMGRHWLKRIAATGLQQDFIDAYPIRMPDPNSLDDAGICAHPDVWQRVAAAAKRGMDGGTLYLHLKKQPTNHAHDGMGLTPTQQAAIETFEAPFIQWFEKLFYQPDQPSQNAWMPDYLEYQFNLAAPDNGGETVFAADEYYHGRLDWYNLDVDPSKESLPDPQASLPPAPPKPETPKTFVPTQITFDGMPNTRWWSFEDERVNFGDVKPGTKDLSTLLLLEFGLVYSNDWFLFPITLPVGTVTRIEGLAVTNVFGERIWIEAAGRGSDNDWERWNMFTLTTKGDEEQAADTRLLLLPTVPKILEGKPIEEIMLIRDEMANMVWGIETVIPLADGRSKSGREAALETRKYYQRLLNQSLDPNAVSAEAEPVAPIRYKVMVNPVPENWIPFIPVHMPNDNRQVQLQRAALPRILDNDPEPPEKIRPRTILMRQGLDEEVPAAYFIHEEEVPRAGIRVAQSYQRTRWNDGRVFTWLGVRKLTGRGEGASNLAFDQILPTGKPEST